MAMADCFVTRTAQGFDVIEGVKLNAEPLSRAEADRLAHERVKPTAKAAKVLGVNQATISRDMQDVSKDDAKRITRAQDAPQPALAVDLRTTRADQAGGSCGFKIKGSPTW
jgi:LmbE family N-acetylglucosaminyl deacetylase